MSDQGRLVDWWLRALGRARAAGAAGGARADRRGAATPWSRLATTQGYYFYGVISAASARSASLAAPEAGELIRVGYRDLDAIVRADRFAIPPADAEHIRAHQEVVEGIMRRTSILPAPFGMLFRGRRPLTRFLEDQYLVLEEGLAFVHGQAEVRVHALPGAAPEQPGDLADLAFHIYAELRRSARAAVTLPPGDRRLLTAAFLVSRKHAEDFIAQVKELDETHPELKLHVTGPWPPYDFVKINP